MFTGCNYNIENVIVNKNKSKTIALPKILRKRVYSYMMWHQFVYEWFYMDYETV